MTDRTNNPNFNNRRIFLSTIACVLFGVAAGAKVTPRVETTTTIKTASNSSATAQGTRAAPAATAATAQGTRAAPATAATAATAQGTRAAPTTAVAATPKPAATAATAKPATTAATAATAPAADEEELSIMEEKIISGLVALNESGKEQVSRFIETLNKKVKE